MVRMTPALRDTYDAISAFIAEYGYAPSFRQLGTLIDVQSSSTVYQRVHALKRMGLVEFNSHEPRTLRIIVCPLPPAEEVA